MDGVQSVLETKYGQDRQLVLHWFEALQQHGVHSLHDLGKKLSNDNEWRNIPLDLLAKALLRQSHDYLTNNTQSTEDQHLSQDDSNYSKYSQDLITLGHEVAKEKEQMLHKEVKQMRRKYKSYKNAEQQQLLPSKLIEVAPTICGSKEVYPKH